MRYFCIPVFRPTTSYRKLGDLFGVHIELMRDGCWPSGLTFRDIIALGYAMLRRL